MNINDLGSKIFAADELIELHAAPFLANIITFVQPHA